jgi:hypothetical protein
MKPLRKSLAGLAAGLLFAASLSQAADYSAWTGSRNIVLNTSASGANVAGNVTKFPVLVRLTQNEANIVAAAKPGGADIRFSKADGTTPLPYQIDTWEPWGASIWVLVDSVKGNNSTQFIKMYWGNPAANSESNVPPVFDTANGFVGVWNLGNAAGASPRPNSVTGAPNALFRNAPITQQPVRGIIGMADSLPGGNGVNDGTGDEAGLGTYLDMGRTPYAGYSDFTKGIHYSIWVNPNANYGGFMRFLQMVDDTTYAAANSSASRIMFLHHTANDGSLAIRTSGLTSANGNSVNFPNHTGTWKQLAFSKGPGTDSVRVYVDGVPFHTFTSIDDIPVSVRTYVSIGRSFDPSNAYLNAKVDAPTLSKVGRSADWNKLSFENQKAANSLVNIGLGGNITSTPYSAWAEHRTITLNTKASGANVSGNVANFPVLIRLTAAEAPIMAAAKAGGADLRFSRTDNTPPFPYHIESWDTSAGGTGAAIWVKLDTVKGNDSLQSFRMHWGNPAASDSSRPAVVFDTANGYVGVWHMNGTGNETDATVNGNTATAVGAPASAAGIIGKGRSFARASSQHFTVANHASLNWTTPALTLSAWIKGNDWEGSSRIFQKGLGTDGNSAQYGMRENSNDQLAIELNGVHTATSSASVPAAGTWALVHARYNGATRQVYLNGVQILTSNYTANITTNTDALNIGRRPDGTNFFNGVMDELRVQNVARSTDWMRLEHENQKLGNSLVNIGTYVPPVVPGAPTGVVAAANTTQASGVVTVTWVAPASNGGANITGYTVTSAPGGLTCSTVGPPAPVTCDVPGLVVGTSYTFTVVATNSAGNSVASAPSNPVVAQAVSVMPGAFSARVNGLNPYTYRLSAASAAVTEALTMTIVDVHGKRVWSRTVNPSKGGGNEITWTGRNASGARVSAGMYIVRVSMKAAGQTIEVDRKSVTLKP